VLAGKPRTNGAHWERIGIPAGIRGICLHEPQRAEEIRPKLRRQFSAHIANGCAAVGFEFVENAFWDAEAQIKGVPLSKLLGGTLNEIVCGVSLGIREDPRSLVRKVEEELRSGYQRIKLKIKPGKDIEYVAAARNEFPDIQLSVDANSAYRLEDAAHLRKLDEFRLLMMAQPLNWDDIYAHSKLQAQIQTAICLDECINDARHALNAIELKACRIINIKLGRVGGHSEARRVEQTCRTHAIQVWCGGMLETGLGRAHNIAMSTLAGFTLPGDVSASKRYWSEDLIEPEVEVTSKGTIRVPKTPGIGYERCEARPNRAAHGACKQLQQPADGGPGVVHERIVFEASQQSRDGSQVAVIPS
jgi:O-succinylbenzoate synthase